MQQDLLQEYHRLTANLQPFNPTWLHVYLNALKQLLTDIGATPNDPRLALTANADGSLAVNIGQRWVSKPLVGEVGAAGFLIPLEADYKALGCEHRFYFTHQKMPAVRWVHYPSKDEVPTALYEQWLIASCAEWQRCTRSGYRRYHSGLFYEVVMRPEAREEVFAEAFGR